MAADLELLQRWRAGDKTAGEELFQRHFADVLRFFDSKVSSKAEDLTQQTFLECVRSQQQFRGDSSFRTYLFAIAWNQLRHYFRGALKNEHIDFDSSSLSELAASITSPSSEVDRERRAHTIHEALARLPVAQQTLLELHYWQELDAAALAEIFGVPAGAVRVRLLRARNALRAALASAPDSDAAKDPLTSSLIELEAADRSAEAATGTS